MKRPIIEHILFESELTELSYNDKILEILTIEYIQFSVGNELTLNFHFTTGTEKNLLSRNSH